MRRGLSGRRSAAALVAALGGLLAGCTGSPSSPDQPAEEPAPPSRRERQVERLLARRARAIRADRLPAFVATTVAGDGRRSQVAAFEALGDLPVATRVVRRELDRPGRRRRGVTRVSAQLLVRLDGFDPRPVAASHVLELEQGERRLAGAARPVRAVPGRGRPVDPRRRPGPDRRGRDPGPRPALRGPGRPAAAAGPGGARRRPAATCRSRCDQGVVVLAPSTIDTLRDDGFRPEEIERLGGIAREVDDRDGDPVAVPGGAGPARCCGRPTTSCST